MTLSVQTKANRANAQKSTGPISANGKAAIKKNAMKHGIHSQIPILAHEDPQFFETLTKEMYDELAPANIMEREMVDRIIMTLIRQRRLRKAETATIQQTIDQAMEAVVQTFEIDEALETFSHELDAMHYTIDYGDLQPLKATAPHVLRYILTQRSTDESNPNNHPTTRLYWICERFKDLKKMVSAYLDRKKAYEKRAQMQAKIFAQQSVPNSPEMHFLMRYQLQLDSELMKLLALYHSLQKARHQQEAREITVIDASTNQLNH